MRGHAVWVSMHVRTVPILRKDSRSPHRGPVTVMNTEASMAKDIEQRTNIVASVFIVVYDSKCEHVMHVRYQKTVGT